MLAAHEEDQELNEEIKELNERYEEDKAEVEDKFKAEKAMKEAWISFHEERLEWIHDYQNGLKQQPRPRRLCLGGIGPF